MAVCAEDFGLKHGQDLVISWMEWRVEREGGIKITRRALGDSSVICLNGK